MKTFLSLLLGFVSFTLFSSLNAASLESSPTICTADYSPVCASVQVQCITTPCNPIEKTYSNVCLAKAAHAKIVSEGACKTDKSVVVGGDSDIYGCKASAGYSWDAGSKKCVRPWEQNEKKMSAKAALMNGVWKLVSLNGAKLTQSGTIEFQNKKFTSHLCNTFGGNYGVFGDRLLFRSVFSTRMYCEGEFRPVEDKLFLPGTRFMVGSDTLTITTKAGDIMIWKK